MANQMQRQVMLSRELRSGNPGNPMRDREDGLRFVVPNQGFDFLHPACGQNQIGCAVPTAKPRILKPGKWQGGKVIRHRFQAAIGPRSLQSRLDDAEAIHRIFLQKPIK